MTNIILEILAGENERKKIAVDESLLRHISQKQLWIFGMLDTQSKSLNFFRQSFNNHKNQVSLIPNDVDEAAEIYKKLKAEFHKDLEEVNLLISDINVAINKQKTERNKSIFQVLFSGIETGAGIFATLVTKDISDKIEYGTSSFFQLLSSRIGGVDIAAAQKIIKELKAYLDEAKNLEKDILAEIDKLRKEFDKLKIAHFPV